MDRNSKIDVEHYRKESNNQTVIIMTFYSCCVTLGKNVFCLLCSCFEVGLRVLLCCSMAGCIFFFNLTRFSFISDWF